VWRQRIVDVQVDTQVAARGDVILLVVFLLDCSQRAVAKERAILYGWICAGSTESLLRNHSNSATSHVIIPIWTITLARVIGYSTVLRVATNRFGLSCVQLFIDITSQNTEWFTVSTIEEQP
jgi:hypothetical protein